MTMMMSYRPMKLTLHFNYQGNFMNEKTSHLRY